MPDPIEDLKQRIERIQQFVSPGGTAFVQQLKERARSQQPIIQPTQVVSPPSDVGKKFFKGAAKLAKDILLEIPARAAASLTLESLQRPEYKPETKSEKFLFGEEPIKPIGKRMEEAIPKGAAIGRRILGRPGEIAGAGLAPFFVAAGTLIDLAPFGGTKRGLEEALLSSKTIGEAAEHLAKARVPEDLIKTYAPKFAEATKIEDVRKGLRSLEDVLKTTKAEVNPEIMSLEKYLQKKGIPEFDYSMQTTKWGRTVKEQKRVEKQLQEILSKQIEAIREYEDKVRKGEIISPPKGEPVMPENIIARIRDTLRLKLLQQGEKPENVEKIISQKTAGIEREIKNLERQGVSPLNIEKILRERILGEEVKPEVLSAIKKAKKAEVRPETKITPKVLQQKAREALKTEVPIVKEVPPKIPPVEPPKVPPSSSLEALPPDNPIRRIVEYFKGWEGAITSQERLRSKELSKRAGAVAGIGERLRGEQAFFAQLKALKGELPKISLADIRSNFSQQDIDYLFDTIESSHLMPLQKVRAKFELAKAMRGVNPTRSGLELLKEVFPEEFVQLAEQVPKATSLLGSIANLPRTLMASIDVSAPLRQGLFMIGRPREFLPSFIDMFKFLAKEENYQGLMEDIVRHPLYELAQKSGLHLTDIEAGLLTKEEMFMGADLAEKIPGIGRMVRASNRAYTGFLNKLRWDSFVNTYNDFAKLGLSKKELENTIMPAMAQFINAATGRGNLSGAWARLAPALNATLFSSLFVSLR